MNVVVVVLVTRASAGQTHPGSQPDRQTFGSSSLGPFEAAGQLFGAARWSHMLAETPTRHFGLQILPSSSRNVGAFHTATDWPV